MAWGYSSAHGVWRTPRPRRGRRLFNLSTKSEAAAVGSRIAVDVKVDSEDVGFNAAQATLKFSSDVLEVTGLDKTGSTFNFWLDEPSFSNSDGKVSFVGGSSYGFVGKSVQILRINFRVKGSGAANIVFLDGAVTASDGSGTNILSSMKGLKIAVAGAGQAVPEAVAPPVQIRRPAAPAAKVPAKPGLSVPLYPDSSMWYNMSATFHVKWALPADVTAVATALSKSPDAVPSKSEGLFEDKSFSALDDGIWYVHVRFRNTIGWGPVAHYRIGIDTAPPAPFSLTVQEGTKTDTPQPHISYAASDGLSGVDHYVIKIGDANPITTQASNFVLPLQAPGKHMLSVRAVDKAGNAAEASVDLEIQPISAPVIAPVRADIFIGEGGLSLTGTAPSNRKVLLWLKSRDERVVQTATVAADSKGNWSELFDQPMRSGSYFVEAVAQDERGALSVPARTELFTVREKPILTLFGTGITQSWFFIGLIALLLIGFTGGWLSNHLWKLQVGRRVVIAQRDTVTVMNLVKKDLDKILEDYADRTITKQEVAEIEFLIKKMKTNLDKMQKYLVENIGEIKD